VYILRIHEDRGDQVTTKIKINIPDASVKKAVIVNSLEEPVEDDEQKILEFSSDN